MAQPAARARGFFDRPTLLSAHITSIDDHHNIHIITYHNTDATPCDL